MFVSIILCKEGINGEVIFIFMTKILLFIPSSVSKFDLAEVKKWQIPLRVRQIIIPEVCFKIKESLEY